MALQAGSQDIYLNGILRIYGCSRQSPQAMSFSTRPAHNTEALAPEDIPAVLLERVAQQCAGPAAESCTRVCGALRETYGAALQGVLFYGSCARGEAMEDGIADIFVIVDDYRNVYDRRYLAYLNARLPPNVFYREIPADGAVIRVKLAVISLADFTGGILHWFHSYLWGRFAQPVRILYARDEAVRTEFHTVLAQAVLMLLRKTIPALPDKPCDAETVWTRALSLSYSAEFRPEPESKAADLVRGNLAGYTGLLEASMPALGDMLRREGAGSYLRSSSAAGRETLRHWRRRRVLGRILSVLRLIKAVLTFTNSVDYAAWKINRHTGVEIEVTPRLRRYPLLFGWRVFLKLVKQGVLR